MDAGTSVATASAYMFVLGFGLGLVMQVLVLAVQNAVDYSQLGVATSGATLFRSIGGSFGASVLGAVFANRLAHNLADQFPGQGSAAAGGFDPATSRTAAARGARRLRARVHRLAQRRLPRRRRDRRGGLRADWLIKELPLRETVATAGVGEAFAVPKDTDPLAELARELSILTRREAARRILERLAIRAGVDLAPAETWLLARLQRDPHLDLAAPSPTRTTSSRPPRARAPAPRGARPGRRCRHRLPALAPAHGCRHADARPRRRLRPRPPERALERLGAGTAPRTARAHQRTRPRISRRGARAHPGIARPTRA